MKNLINNSAQKHFIIILSITGLFISCDSKNSPSGDTTDSVFQIETVNDTTAVTEQPEYVLEDEVPVSFSDGVVTVKVKDIVDLIFTDDEEIYFANTSNAETSFEVDHFAEITNPNPLSIFKIPEGCSDAAILRFSRSKGDESYIDWVLITKGVKEELVFSKVTADVTEIQNTATATINFENELGNGCPVITVTEESEGGDIDLSRNKTITMYAIKEGQLKIIFTLIAENYISYSHWAESGNKTDGSDSTATEEPAEYSGEKSTIREVELSASRTLGMADLIVTTKVMRNKKLTDNSKEIPTGGMAMCM